MHTPLICPGESWYHIAYKQSGRLVHLQRLPKQGLVHSASACTNKSTSGNSSSAGATCVSQHATSRKDCRGEQTEGWSWQGYGAVVGSLLGEVPAPSQGLALLPARVWLKASFPPDAGGWGEKHEANKAHDCWSIQPGVWVLAEESLHLHWDAGPAAPWRGVLSACTNLLRSLLLLPNPSFSPQPCPSMSLHSYTSSSPALFYPVHQFFISIYLLLCCATHLKESALRELNDIQALPCWFSCYTLSLHLFHF